MTERAIRHETSSGAREFAQTWSLAKQAFIKETCTTPASVYAYKGDLKNLYQFLQERNVESWEEIKRGDLLDFFERPQTKSPQKYSPASIDRQVATVRTFFEWIKDYTEHPISNQIIETMRSIKWHPENGRRNTAEKLLSRSELSSIAANPDSRDQALIRLVMTGIRLSQLTQLTVQDVKGDLTSPQPHLKIEVPVIKERKRLWEKKSLDDETSLALKQYLRKKGVDSTSLDDESLFGISRQWMWAIVRVWSEEIGIPCTPRLLAKSARQLAK